MATDIEKLVVSLSADIRSYEKALAKATGVTTSELRKMERATQVSVGRVEKSLGKMGSTIGGFGKGLAIGGITTAVAGIEELIRTSVTGAAAIGDLADKLGISTEKLQELQYGAVQANMDFDDLEKGLLKFSKSLGEARNGQGELLKTLEANGFDKAKIKAMSYSEALDTVADLIRYAANEQDGMLINSQAFGKGADNFLEFLKGGKQGVKDFGDAAQRADAIIKDGLIKSAQAIDDKWAAAMKSMESKAKSMVLTVIEEFSKLGSNEVSPNSKAGYLLRNQNNPPKPITELSTNIFSEAGNLGGRNYSPPPKPSVVEDPDAKAKREAATRAYVDQRKAVTGLLTALKFEIEQGKASELQQQINLKLRELNSTATAEERQQVIDLTTAKFNQAQAEELSLKLGQDQLALEQELYDSKMQLAEAAYSAFEAIAIGGEKASDVIKDLASSLLKAAVQASLFGTGPFASLFGTSGGGGLFGGLFKAPGRAGGGHVNAGQPYVVGERRPELFVPSQSGSIVPRIGGSSGGTKITVNNFAGVDVKTSQDSGGNPIIALRKIVADTIAGGFANSAMRSQFGVTPQKVRR